MATASPKSNTVSTKIIGQGVGAGPVFRLCVGAVVIAALVFMAASASAADMNVRDVRSATIKTPAPPSPWQFQFTPYVWMPFVTGETQIGSTTSGVNTNFVDIFRRADRIYPWMSYQELRNGPFSIYANVIWSRMRFSDTRSGIFPIGPLNRSSLGIVADSKIWLDMAIIESGFTYQFAQWRSGGAGNGSVQSTAVDVVAGGRYWFLRPDIDLNVTATVNIPALGLTRTGAGNVSATTTIDWLDPFVGLRLRHAFAAGNELVLQGDVGGFGIGSQFAWQALATYNIATRFLGLDLAGYVGYRALSIDYTEGSENNTLALDLILHGPVVGLTFTW